MKLPVFKNLAKTVTAEQMEAALEVLEAYADSRAVKEEEQEAIGEIISNICGAMEMQQMLADGMDEREAANTFMQRVMGCITK